MNSLARVARTECIIWQYVWIHNLTLHDFLLFAFNFKIELWLSWIRAANALRLLSHLILGNGNGYRCRQYGPLTSKP